MNILVVEDEAKISELLGRGLREAGYVVDFARDGIEALIQLGQKTFDLIVLDLMLPGMDGLEVLRNARARKILTPVIILSARQSLEDRLLGLRAGGDDYILKPFSFEELLVRIETVLRRSSDGAGATSLSFDDLTINLLTREVTRDGTRIELQAREFALLECLLRSPERVLTKTLILEKVWDYHFDPQTNVVDVLVCRLRAKVDRGFQTKLIHTIRGMGYALKRG